MLIKNSSKITAMASLNTIERILKDLRASIQNADGSVPEKELVKNPKPKSPNIYDKKSMKPKSSLNIEYLARMAETKQSPNGDVNIKISNPNQPQEGLPEIKPGIKTEEPSIEMHQTPKPIVDKKYELKPSKEMEALARETEKALSGVKDGQDIETPTNVYNKEGI